MVALLRDQLKNLLAGGGKIRRAVQATDADIRGIRADIAALEKGIAQERSKLN